jgi:methylmalonyl-CoA mutase
LAEIADTVRGYKLKARAQARLARESSATARRCRHAGRKQTWQSQGMPKLRWSWQFKREERMDPAAKKLVAQWPAMQKAYAGDEYVVKIRDKEIRTALTTKSLSGTTIRKVVPAAPTKTTVKS